MSSSTTDVYASKKTFEIPLLRDDGSNYNAWKFRQQTVLKLCGLNAVATGTEKPPVELTAAEAKDSAQATAYEAELKAWTQKDEQAFAQITLNMEDGAMADVMETTSAYEAWTRVVERWEGKGMQSVSFLYEQLTTMKMNDGDNVTEYYNQLRSLTSKLKTLGQPLVDELVALIFMNNLSPEYAIVRTVVQTANKTITPELVFQAVLAEEERLKKGRGTTALIARAGSSRSGGGGNSKDDKSKRGKNGQNGQKREKCPICKRTGHTRQQCWAPGGGSEGQGPHQKKKADPPKDSKEKSKSESKPAESAKLAIVSGRADSPEPYTTIYALATLHNANVPLDWILDSGASAHMTSNRSWFSTYETLDPPIEITLGDDSIIYAEGAGRVLVNLKNKSGQTTETYFQRVLHVPELRANLVSVRVLQRAGHKVLFERDHESAQIIARDNASIGYATVRRGVYILNAKVNTPSAASYVAVVSPDSENTEDDDEAAEVVAYTAQTVARADISTWHRRLGHINYEYVLDMVRKGHVKGMDIVGSRKPPSVVCEACMKGKQTRTPFPKESTHRSSKILELLHSDLHGKVSTQAFGGYQYFSVTVDDYSRKIWVHLLKAKSDYEACFKELRASVEKSTGEQIKALRTDGGGEYGSNAFEEYFRKHGIARQKTEAHSSQSNGVAERAIRTLNDRQRSMREDAGMSDAYWGYAILHAANIWNMTPKKALGGRTPDEVFTGIKPDVSRLRIFGCKAWARVPDEKRQKLDARSLECTYLGYAPNRKAHVLVHHPTRRFITSRDVVFDEGSGSRQRVIIEDITIAQNSTEPDAKSEAEPEADSEPKEVQGDESDDEEATESERTRQAKGNTPEIEQPQERDQVTHQEPEPPIQTGRPIRTRRAPARDDDNRFFVTSYRGRSARSKTKAQSAVSVGATVAKPTVEDAPASVGAGVTESEEERAEIELALAAVIEEQPPATYDEAMGREDAPRWLEAMLEELRSIDKFGVWSDVDPPSWANIVGCRWVYDYKRDASGAVTRYKARLVAKGYSQRAGVDSNEIWSPVARLTAIRVLLAIVAAKDYELDQLDVKTAFLHSPLKEQIYMHQPEGFGTGDGKVKVLHKAIYGLKQGSRAFYDKVNDTLKEIGFTRCESDPAVFTYRRDGEEAILLAHVDDFLLAGSSRSFLDEIKVELKSVFDISDLGPAHLFVGIEIVRNRTAKTITIHQARYVRDILSRFGMSDCKPVDTPMSEGLHLEKLDSPEMNRSLYQSGIGSLMYAMIGTRPDISFSTGLLAQHSNSPANEHWLAFKRVLRYLKGTTELGITYDGSKPLLPVGFVDSDFAGDKNSSRSTTGWTFTMTGGSVSWASRKQPTISLSSTEAERVASSNAAREAVWLNMLLDELGCYPNGLPPLVLYTNNQSNIALTKSRGHHSHTKHIRVHHHFVREMVEHGEIDLQYLSTEEQVADVLTKALGKIKFSRFISLMGMSSH
ncbi:Copia-like polyprotein/retrotransposon [Ceratobasidium sp. AG-Ba]|nr:Copia-like polyprotein/retrotransposon [Ceratobasidium sp. AG-Ba]